MYKIFYDKKTKKIKGFSDGENSLDLPFVESEMRPMPIENFKIEKGKLVPIKEAFTAAEWEQLTK